MPPRFLAIDGLCYLPDPSNADYLKIARDAGVSAIHFTVPRVTDRTADAFHRLGRWRRLIRDNSDVALLVENAADVLRAYETGKVGVILGMQDALPVEPNLDLVDAFHAAGLRIIQVTYQRQNAFGSGCGEDRDHGLSRAGRELVERCNQIGMALDASHCGLKTSAEIAEHSTRPVFITHSAARAFTKHVRTKTDEVIKAVAARGGCVGVLTYRVMLTDDWQGRVTIDKFVDHLEHILKVAGEDHVSLGLDFTPGWTEREYDEAAAAFPEIYQGCPFARKHLEGMESIKDLPAIVRCLEKRGHSARTIDKIMGRNFLRVFQAACG